MMRTSADFQSGYDAAAKVKQLIIDALEADNARLRAEIGDLRKALARKFPQDGD